MDNIGIGLELMIVGMCTVFAILIIVIQLSKLLIKCVNAWAPAETVPAKKASPAAAAPAAVPADVMQVLNAAVAQITGGKGHITNVKPL